MPAPSTSHEPVPPPRNTSTRSLDYPYQLTLRAKLERVFAEVTRDLLQRSDHRSVQALEKDLRDWVKAWNENPKPFIWTKTADSILESLGRLLQRINGAGH